MGAADLQSVEIKAETTYNTEKENYIENSSSNQTVDISKKADFKTKAETTYNTEKENNIENSSSNQTVGISKKAGAKNKAKIEFIYLFTYALNNII